MSLSVLMSKSSWMLDSVPPTCDEMTKSTGREPSSLFTLVRVRWVPLMSSCGLSMSPVQVMVLPLAMSKFFCAISGGV